MNELAEASQPSRRGMTLLVATLVIILLVGLPLAVWMDLRGLSEQILRSQAREIGQLIDDVRAFYASDVVGRIQQQKGGTTQVTHRYTETPGAIPIPATFSIELGNTVGKRNATVSYRFVSDLPFKDRPPYALDAFEKGALASLRSDSSKPVVEVSGGLLDRTVHVATPVVMGAACVACHNIHPASPKTDWKVGDVRGIQEISIVQPIQANLLSFKWLIGYFGLVVLAGTVFILLQFRQSRLIQRMNSELVEANDFLATISMKIAKYISPQIYKSIFSGKKDVAITTERKKLTIFFSDIKDFTATTERMQPEELTRLLNEYLTEMSKIALHHGGTVDKFVGDAMLVFFGDPESRGVEEDAHACLRMAIDMQRRLHELDAAWRARGIESPFRVRMGINTGFCNVGNFGSDDRMDYTIIGAEANLAARLQSIAEPGEIVMSFETYALVRDVVRARAAPPITMKGISRPIIPYVLEAVEGRRAAAPASVISEKIEGGEVYLDVDALGTEAAKRMKAALGAALKAIEEREAASPSLPGGAG